MSIRLRHLVAILLTAIATPLHAQAGNYYLSATNPSNGFDLFLTPGRWSIGVTDGGWSPWNYVEDCDALGANCHTGFHTIFYYTVDGGPLQRWGIDGSEFETASYSDFYATPALALAHALPPLQLDFASASTVRAFIPDCCYGDNTGGLTLTVASVAVVPEPATLGLLAAGLLGIAGARFGRSRRRRE